MGDFWLPEAASSIAPEVDSLFIFVTVVSLIFLVGVTGAMLYFVYRYRRQHPGERPAPVEESRALEISWIVIPTILVLLVFNWGFKSYVKMNVTPSGAYEIQARAQQWNFLFEYPNGVTTDTLVIPRGKEVKMKMSSTDVLHGFYIPAFRVKYDILPNRYTSVWFKATERGEYDLFCTEYCGRDHSEMNKVVRVVSQKDFQEWLKKAGTPKDIPLPKLGEQLYTQRGCQSCHSLDGSQKVGPSFQGLYGTENHQMTDGSTVTVDENYLRESILKPEAKVVQGYNNLMPGSYSGLSERQLSGLIEFIKEQSDKDPPSSDAQQSASAAAD
ncbi:cytochrome c oxidase subunit II [Salinibacter sp. 10B]|uniref:cytochrome c oxidase subunit II n=1 Tax=Salinibacter sp. 10B TaxID=1923971 RepID=UPI000CF4569B|nr:cytochrome c oxidase subunit II [Salinibacter sp. 10B]PQJ35723.1 cytochrome c oxidase subunit II [Salinibacter sp. 10B]